MQKEMRGVKQEDILWQGRGREAMIGVLKLCVPIRLLILIRARLLAGLGYTRHSHTLEQSTHVQMKMMMAADRAPPCTLRP